MQYLFPEVTSSTSNVAAASTGAAAETQADSGKDGGAGELQTVGAACGAAVARDPDTGTDEVTVRSYLYR